MALEQERQVVWQGVLEWNEKGPNLTKAENFTSRIPCQALAISNNGEPELNADSWPQKLIVHMIHKQLIGNIGKAAFKDSKNVILNPTACTALDDLTKILSDDYSGIVQLASIPSTTACDIRIMILLYLATKNVYVGFIPNDQAAFIDRLQKVVLIQQSNVIKSLMKQKQGSGLPVSQPVSAGPSNVIGRQTPLADHVMKMARQQNLLQIQELHRSLEAAQQQESQPEPEVECSLCICVVL